MWYILLTVCCPLFLSGIIHVMGHSDVTGWVPVKQECACTTPVYSFSRCTTSSCVTPAGIAQPILKSTDWCPEEMGLHLYIHHTHAEQRETEGGGPLHEHACDVGCCTETAKSIARDGISYSEQSEVFPTLSSPMLCLSSA